jgi:hypothetical protein
MVAGPWFERFDEYRDQVQEKKRRYEDRCRQLGMQPGQIQEEPRRDLIARIVRESNWQENYYLTVAETRELAEAVFDEPSSISGPRLDMETVIEGHRRQVIKLRREKASTEQIAAYNLSRAQVALEWIYKELILRQVVAIIDFLRQVRAHPDLLSEENRPPPEAAALIDGLLSTWEDGIASNAPHYAPLNVAVGTLGDVAKQLQTIDLTHLVNPLKVDYIHFLHRLTTLGLIETPKCGRFRKKAVHIAGNLELLFPASSAVPGLMKEYCEHFPTPIMVRTAGVQGVLVLLRHMGIASNTSLVGSNEELLVRVARASHAFVRIHPYADGNGRLSRLLMNLALWNTYPPLYLKADGKGKHRYAQALKRADRGNYKPLAALIALSLSDVYDRLLASVTPGA